MKPNGYTFTNRKHPWMLHSVYILCLFLPTATAVSLPFLYTDISVHASGLVRPAVERMYLRSPASAMIDSIYYRDGASVRMGDTLIRLRDPVTAGKRYRAGNDLARCRQYLHDIDRLLDAKADSAVLTFLATPLYREQLAYYLQQRNELNVLASKAVREWSMNNALALQNAVSRKELFDAANANDKIAHEIKTLTESYRNTWQQDRARYEADSARLVFELQQTETGSTAYVIAAPADGLLQGTAGLHRDVWLNAGEEVGTLSPAGVMVAECFAETKDAGLLRPGLIARYRVDAFDPGLFGVLTGKILSLDDDYTAIDSRRLFRLRCSFDDTQLRLKNGRSFQIRKGMQLHASFLVARRSLWQLLFEKAGNWFYEPERPGPLPV